MFIPKIYNKILKSSWRVHFLSLLFYSVMAESNMNFSTVIQYLIVALFNYQLDFEMNLSTFAFLRNIFENCNLMKNKKYSIFSKLSSFYLGSLLECIWTPQLPFWYQIKHRSFGKNFSFFKIFGVKSQFLIKAER